MIKIQWWSRYWAGIPRGRGGGSRSNLEENSWSQDRGSRNKVERGESLGCQPYPLALFHRSPVLLAGNTSRQRKSKLWLSTLSYWSFLLTFLYSLALAVIFEVNLACAQSILSQTFFTLQSLRLVVGHTVNYFYQSVQLKNSLFLFLSNF